MNNEEMDKLVAELEKLPPRQLAARMMARCNEDVPIEARALMIEAAFRLSKLTGTR